MSDDFRVDRWVWYGALFFGLVAFNLWLGNQVPQVQWLIFCLFATWPIALLAGWAMVRNYRDYFKQRDLDMFSQHQNALSITADSRRLEMAKGVHPEVFKLLLGERDRVWMFISGTKSPNRRPYAILAADPKVTDYFVSYFLENSTETECMKKHGMVNEKDFRFDPRREVSSFEMYDRLVTVLHQEMKCTMPFLNAPPLWLNPWTPETVKDDFGWGGPEKEEPVTERVETRKAYLERTAAIERSQPSSGGDYITETLKKTVSNWKPGSSQMASDVISDDELQRLKSMG